MKSERLTLSLTRAEKEQIDSQAAILGISASEFIRKAASLIDAQDIQALEDIRVLLPEFNAAVDRIHDNLEAALESSLKHERERAGLHRREYRSRLGTSLIRNHWEDIQATARVLESGADDVTPVQGGTLFERMSSSARSGRSSSVQDSALDLPPETGKKKA